MAKNPGAHQAERQRVTVLGAVFRPATVGRFEYAEPLASDLRAGMLLLGDRNFAADLLNHIAATGAALYLGRDRPSGRRRGHSAGAREPRRNSSSASTSS
ncbi:hypothetical protein ACIREM_23155 [Streptomyces shenzhenensis]|uniref:hypothetical protein n=1 Tax=Streptomyces shenzhenensis TaxID=943815 RepID=UPI0038262F8D